MYDFISYMEGVMEGKSNDREFTVLPKLKSYTKTKILADMLIKRENACWILSKYRYYRRKLRSPVLNANGELIGCAFDGNWEAMSGDIAFEPDLQRTISVDIVTFCLSTNLQGKTLG